MTKDLVSIAGYDPSGGAGVLLDLAVFERLGYRGFGVLTAVTAQTAARVARVHPVAPEAVVGQFESLAGTRPVAGIKVGMLATAANLAAVAGLLARRKVVPRVVDPVLRATSGADLLRRRAWPLFLDAFRGRIDLLTPNLDEAGIFTGRRPESVTGMRDAARAIGRAVRAACLVKGGHLEGRAVDVLWDGRTAAVFEHPRHGSSDVHGTGCFLSAAVVGYLAGGLGLEEACVRAIALTAESIRDSLPADGGRRVFAISRGRRRARPLPLSGR